MENLIAEIEPLIDLIYESNEVAMNYETLLRSLKPETLHRHCLALDLAYEKLRKTHTKISDDWYNHGISTDYETRSKITRARYTVKKMRQIAISVARENNKYFYQLKYFKDTAKKNLSTEMFTRIDNEAQYLFHNYKPKD